MLDRVTERRRAAQLARHYRDQEGLSISRSYAAVGGPNQVASASGSPTLVPSPTQAT